MRFSPDVGAFPGANGAADSPDRERSQVDVLVAGAGTPPNPGELVESQAMSALLTRLRTWYDVIVIDTPPLTSVSDAFPLFRLVDGVVVVGRMGRSQTDVVRRLRGVLEGVDAPLLGVVANGYKARRDAQYGASYEYYVPSEAAANGATTTPTASRTAT